MLSEGTTQVIPQATPPQSSRSASATISGTADTVGGAPWVGVKIDLDMPYEAFCTTSWGAPCRASDKNDRALSLAFNTAAPPDGGKVEWRVTPIPLSQAYRAERQLVSTRDETLGQYADDIRRLENKVYACHQAYDGLLDKITDRNLKPTAELAEAVHDYLAAPQVASIELRAREQALLRAGKVFRDAFPNPCTLTDK